MKNPVLKDVSLIRKVPTEKARVKVIASCLTVVLLITSSDLAQSAALDSQSAASPAETQRIAKIRTAVQKMGTGGHVRVTLREPSSEVKGFISAIRDDGFDVTKEKAGEVVAIPYSNVEKLRGPGMSRGTKIAIGVTVVVLATVGIIVAVIVTHFKGPNVKI